MLNPQAENFMEWLKESKGFEPHITMCFTLSKETEEVIQKLESAIIAELEYINMFKEKNGELINAEV